MGGAPGGSALLVRGPGCSPRPQWPVRRLLPHASLAPGRTTPHGRAQTRDADDSWMNTPGLGENGLPNRSTAKSDFYSFSLGSPTRENTLREFRGHWPGVSGGWDAVPHPERPQRPPPGQDALLGCGCEPWLGCERGSQSVLHPRSLQNELTCPQVRLKKKKFSGVLFPPSNLKNKTHNCVSRTRYTKRAVRNADTPERGSVRVGRGGQPSVCCSRRGRRWGVGCRGARAGAGGLALARSLREVGGRGPDCGAVQ